MLNGECSRYRERAGLLKRPGPRSFRPCPVQPCALTSAFGIQTSALQERLRAARFPRGAWRRGLAFGGGAAALVALQLPLRLGLVLRSLGLVLPFGLLAAEAFGSRA